MWYILSSWTDVIYDLNIILYGPPGTGKTYHSVIYAVAICDGKDIEEVKRMPSFAYKQYIREGFGEWIDRIIQKYQIKDQDIPKRLNILQGERDTAVTLLKALHTREGISAAALEEIMRQGQGSFYQKNIITYAIKSPNRRVEIELRNGETLLHQKIEFIVNSAFYEIGIYMPLILEMDEDKDIIYELLHADSN